MAVVIQKRCYIYNIIMYVPLFEIRGGSMAGFIIFCGSGGVVCVICGLLWRHQQFGLHDCLMGNRCSGLEWQYRLDDVGMFSLAFVK